MVALDITLELAPELAQEAEKRGLLTTQALGRLTTSEVERQKQIDQLFVTIDRLNEANKGDLTEVDIEAEIAAYRIAPSESLT